MRKKLLEIAWHLKSDHIAVLACLLITLGQAFHTYYIVLYSSRLDWYLKYPQAIIIAIVLSLGLLINVFRAGSSENLKIRAKHLKYSAIFAAIEIFINVHYWSKKMIYIPYRDEVEMEWFDFIAALVLSFVLPWLLYTYAGNIKIPDNLNFFGKKLIKVVGKGETKNEHIVEVKDIK